VSKRGILNYVEIQGIVYLFLGTRPNNYTEESTKIDHFYNYDGNPLHALQLRA